MLARALLSMSTFDTNILRNGAELQLSEQPLPITRPIHLRGDDLFFVYLITIFLNAALLFLIEPMVAKMILPFLGGTPAVWNLSLFFFQALLLAGYLYAHLGNSWLGPKRHALVHLAIVVFAVVFLPVVVRNHWFAVPVDQPERIVLSVLFVSVGFPFFVLAAGSPLIQKWFANTTHPVARDPYFLYAASNLGSIVGLIAYPTILEPYFSLADQSRSWFYGYLALIAFTSACVFFLWRFFFAQAHEDSPKPAKAYASLEINSSEVTLTRRIRWLVLSFVPSSLLLGVTTYVTTDVASVPLFWIIPLALYLLSFVITFSRRVWISHSFVVRRQGFLLLAAAITVFAQATTPGWLLVPLHLVTFFATALVCHGELVQDRPSTRHLTEFYLWLSIGGVVGGFFNALLAPIVFRSVQEYPLAMIAAALVRPCLDEDRRSRQDHWLDLLLPMALGLFVAGVILWSQENPLISARNAYRLVFGLSGVLCLSFARRPLRFGLGMGAVLIVSGFYPSSYGDLLYGNRSFFGVYRAMLDKSEKYHLLFHGTTIHGAQRLDPERRLEPTGYYHSKGPAGQVFSVFAKTHESGNVAIVGLGTGTLACQGTPLQSFTFFEIDPLVEQIARNPNLFTFLRDCPPQIKVTLGDARISLVQAPAHHYQLFVLDAFSSDVIPVHLLTREAIQLYLSKLDENGILFFHISNRYMDLVPVLDRLGSSLSLVVLVRDDVHATSAEQEDGKTPSRWVIMSRRRGVVAEFLSDPSWKLLEGRSAGDLWTDDYSNILRVIHWKS